MTIPRISFAAGQVNTSGDQTLIAAPLPGQELVLTFVAIQNASSSALTMILKAGGSIFLRLLGQTQGDGLVSTIPVEREWRLGSGNPLVLNLSSGAACNYTVAYYIDKVMI